LLGTLVVAASAFAGGKEPAAPEVTTVVKETVVYKSAGIGGSVTFHYAIMGPAGAAKNKVTKKKYYRDAVGNSGDFGRFQIDGSIPLGEKDAMGFTVRTDHELGLSDKDQSFRTGNTRFRLWYTHKHDFLNATSKLWYGDNGDAYNQDVLSSGAGVSADVADQATSAIAGLKNYPGLGVTWGRVNTLEYSFMVPLAEYFFDNDFVKTTSFNVGPVVGYTWDHSNSIQIGTTKYNYPNSRTYFGGIGLTTSHAFPLNFGLTFNVYALYASADQKLYGEDANGDADSKTDFYVFSSLYLTNTTKLVDLSDSAALSFVFKAGFDPYIFSSEKYYGSNIGLEGKKGTGYYELCVMPALRVDWAASDTVSVFAEVGADYRNTERKVSSAQGWTWSPYADLGFTVKF
jgi:hypothetical protein